MDHGGHGGHEMPGPQCSLHMLWNTQIINTCIVFPQWRISSKFSFVISFFIIVALGVFYEYLRVIQRTLDQRIALSLASGKGKARPRSRSVSGRSSPEDVAEDVGLLNGRRVSSKAIDPGYPIPPFPRALRAVVYGATIFLSFFLMLVFMTYNAYLILAVVIGAAIGHYIFGAFMNVDEVLSGGRSASKTMACH